MLEDSATIELFDNIIKRVWDMPLTPNERVLFMTASRLVSKIWCARFLDIAASDVHIPCESFYNVYFRAYRNFDQCKRITFTVYDPTNAHPTSRTLFYMRREDMDQLDMLDTIRIVYHDTTYPDPYSQVFITALPDYVKKLSVSYTFSPDVPSCLIEYYRKHFDREFTTRFAGPHVGILEVNGATKLIAAVWESLFPSRWRIVRDGKDSRKPLMKIRGKYDVTMGMLYECSIRQIQKDRRKDSARKRQVREALGLKPLIIQQVRVGGVTLLSTDPTYVPSHVDFPQTADVGDLGYIEGRSFKPIFNALQPQYIDNWVIPGIYIYGDCVVKTIYGDGTCEKCHGRNTWRMNRWVKELLNGAEKKQKIKCIDPKKDGTVRKWLEANIDMVANLYRANLFVHQENIVLVTGITTVE